MDFELIGNLVRLRYRLLWARTRTRNGKIAIFFVGYLLLVFLLVLFSLGGIGAGMVAIRSGKGAALAAGILGGLYVQALFATILLGFGINAVFADSELRRYPLNAVERRVVRHFIGILDPFWFLILALDLGLAMGLFLFGPGSLLGVVAALLLFASNYLFARVAGMLVERLVEKKGGAAVLLATICCLGLLPALGNTAVKKNPHALDPMLKVLQQTPPFGAAAAMTGSGMPAFQGALVIVWWLLGLAAVLVILERRPRGTRIVQATAMSWGGIFERAGALFGPEHGPLVAQWLRFYSRNNRFRTIYPLAMPLVAFLAVTQAQTAGKNGQFANLLGSFVLMGFIGTGQFAVNQFGYLGGGFRRYLLLPADPVAVLRTGSYTFLFLSSILIPFATIALLVFTPVPLDARRLAMMVGGAVTTLFLMHGLALWATLLGPRRGNYYGTFGNDLSLAGNIVIIGGMLTLLFLPRVLQKVWPGTLAAENWWAVVPLVVLAAVFYFVSLRNAGSSFRKRREQILAIVEGRG